MPPLALVGGLAFAALFVGGLMITLVKFSIGIEALGAFVVLAAVITIIAFALKPAIGWVGIFPTALFGGMALFELVYLA